MTADFNFDRDEPILRRSPTVLRALLADLPPRITDANYGPGTWSAREVVAHLVFGERTDWIPRTRIILSEGEKKPFTSFDRNGHAPLVVQHTLAQLLDIFAAERAANLDTLRGLALTPEMLSRRGMHPELGSVNLSNMLCAWVVHDLNHIAQICKALAYQHKAGVGPWEEFMSILAPPAPR